MADEKLQKWEVIVRSSDPNELAVALRKALEGSLYGYYCYTAHISGKGTAASGRFLSPRRREGAMALAKPLLPTQAAAQLINDWKWKATYHPLVHPDEIKGWEIRVTIEDEAPLVIAWARWVPQPVPAMPVFI